MKDCRNEYTLDLIQQMYNILVLSMSSRTLSILLWPSWHWVYKFMTKKPQNILDAFGSEMIDLVSWDQSMDSQKSLFCRYGPWKRLNEFIVLWLQ